MGHDPGAEAAVGDIDVIVRSGMDGDREVDCGQLDDLDPAGWAPGPTGRKTSVNPVPSVNNSLE